MAILEMLVKQSPWLLDFDAIHRDVHLSRLKAFPLIHHENEFLDYEFEDGVYIVTGPRQIGKSTHLKMLIQNKMSQESNERFMYFNCDLLDKKKEIVEVVETYLSEFPSKERRFVLLDEITSVSDSFLAIKFLIDSGHDKNVTYILTGSNTISIKKTGEYLPGRRGKGIDFLFKPISFRKFVQLLHPSLKLNITWNSPDKAFLELEKKVDLRKALEVYLQTGGFPRVINEYHQNKEIGDDIFTIYRSWLTSEIAKAEKKEYIAKRILERSIISLSRDISYNSIAQDSGVGSHNTIYDYLEFLSSAYVVTPIFHYDIHQHKINYRKNKKIYFNDPFIYAVVEAWLSGKPRQDYDYLKQAVLRSQIVENLVFLKLSEHTDEVHFFQQQQEVDFVTSNFLVEVKYRNRVVPNDYNQLSKEHAWRAVLVTKDKLGTDGNIRLLPIEHFLICNHTM